MSQKWLSLLYCRWIPKTGQRADWPEWASTGSKKQQNGPTCSTAKISSVLSNFGYPAAVEQ